MLEKGIGMGSAGTGGIGGNSGGGSAAGSDTMELMLFSVIDAVVLISGMSLSSTAAVDDAAMFSSSDAVKSIASPSALTTEDLSSSPATVTDVHQC